jgi:hypothetical protein
MFARLKKSGRYEYLQIVENRRDGGKTTQRVLCTVGRLDQLHAKGSIESLVQSLSRFSEKVLLILSGKSDVSASAKKIGPALIFERLWEEHEIKKVLQGLLSERGSNLMRKEPSSSPCFVDFSFPALIDPVTNGSGIT